MDKRTKEYKQWLKENQQGVGDAVDYVLNETPLKNITNLAKKVIFKDKKDCGCDGRKKALNKILPFNFKPTRCFNEDEYIDYKYFKENRTLRNVMLDKKYICKLYSSLFGKPYYEPPSNGSLKPVLRMIELLDKVFDSYEKQ